MSPTSDDASRASGGTHRPNQRWYQFSLRTLLIAVTLAAVGLLAWRTYVEPYRHQRETMQLIEKLGGTYQAAEAPAWMRGLAGVDFQNVTSVNVVDLDEPGAFMEAIAALPELRTLAVGGLAFNDDQLRRLQGLSRLSGLVLDSTSVSEEGLAALKRTLPQLDVYRSDRRAIAAVTDRLVSISKESGPSPPPWTQVFADELFVRGRTVDIRHMMMRGGDLRFLRGFSGIRLLDFGYSRVADADLAEIEPLRQLTHLDLGHTAISDAGLEHVRPLRQLKSLQLEFTDVSDDGLACLRELTDIEVLDLSGTRITDAGWEQLAGLTKLRDLNLNSTKVSDASVARLKELRYLKWLDIRSSRVTRSRAKELEQVLPQCTVIYW